MATTSPPVFDDREFLERVGRDYALAADVARLFLEDCPRRIIAMRDALGRRDAATLRTEAHGLKGAAGNMSAAALSTAARDLEQAASQQQFDAAADLLGRVIREADAVLDAVRSFESRVSTRRSG
jgi:HPt (histidine-containing phosphotransfer) domain-containing protein